jgi:NAD(P)-dependent dehydrogenase (short-subunit alcohol dehydrogenase family)
VEILSAVEEQMPQLPKVTPEMIGTLRTLGQICQFLSGKNGGRHMELGENETRHTPKPAVNEIVSFAPRYVVRPVPANLEHGKKFNLPKGYHLGIVSGRKDISDALISILGKESISAIELYHSASIESDRCLGGLVFIAPFAPVESFTITKAAAPSLQDAAKIGETVFVTVSFLDGAFGFNGGSITDPLQGALAGLAKTAALEWPNVRCRAVDISNLWLDPQKIAQALADEILFNYNPEQVEIGLNAAGSRVALLMDPVPADRSMPVKLDSSDVAVFCGGGRGITAETAKALFLATRCRIALIGRSPAPLQEPAWLSPLQDEAQIKKAIFEIHFKGNANPRQVEDYYRAVCANREISQKLAAITESGGYAKYYSADVRDVSMLKAAMEKIREELGPVRALVHGAGVLEDRLIVEKDEIQFQRVFDTKVKGFENLIATSPMGQLHYLIIFSSVTARMGNIGQVDYAMANEALNKMARRLASEYTQCKVISINWGPWDGGMVTPGLRRNFIKRGVPLLTISQGAQAFINEMRLGTHSPVEVVIGGSLGYPATTSEMVDYRTNNPNAQYNPELFQAACKDIDIERYPILESHQLNGRPVVPLSLITEWLAHSALHANPGLTLHGLDNLRVLKGITLDKPSQTIRLMAGKASRNGDRYEADVEIRDGVKENTVVIHSRAKAILTEKLPIAPLFKENGHFKGKKNYRSINEIYERILFHGNHLRGIRQLIAISKTGLSAYIDAAPAPENWVSEPLRRRWIADPLILDCAFQMAIIWCHEEKGEVCLPSYASSYRQYRERFPEEGVIAVLEVESVTDRKMVGNFYFLDEQKKVVAEIKGYEATIDSNLRSTFHKQS